MREAKKKRVPRVRAWCPGSHAPIQGGNRRHVRCPRCGQRFLASENPCCGSDEKGPTHNRDNRAKGGMRHGNTCHPVPWRVPRHKANLKASEL